MSVSESLQLKCTESIALAEDLKNVRLANFSEDLTLRSERELIRQILNNVTLCVKQLAMEVEQLDRRIEDVCSKLTR